MKRDLRQQLRKALDALAPEQLAAKSAAAAQRLVEQPEFARAEVLMVFLSLPREVDTTPIVLRSWQLGKRVLAPKVNWEQRRMIPIEIRSLTEDLTRSELGVREPVSGLPIPVSLIDLVIVPGLGFDARGNRLGRGRGFYDRFLAHPEFRAVSCALAFEEQVTDDIPAEPLDRPMDMLITDGKVRRFKPTGPRRK